MIEFDAGYSRTGTIEALVSTCDGCKENILCVVVDSSDGEYSSGAICSACSDVQARFSKGRDLEIKLPTFAGI